MQMQGELVVEWVLSSGWSSVIVVADDVSWDVELAQALQAKGVQVTLVAPGCLSEDDVADGYIYGLDCQDAKFKHLLPGQFVVSATKLAEDVVPLD